MISDMYGYVLSSSIDTQCGDKLPIFLKYQAFGVSLDLTRWKRLLGHSSRITQLRKGECHSTVPRNWMASTGGNALGDVYQRGPLFTPYDIRTSSKMSNLAPKNWRQSMTPTQTLHEIYRGNSFNCTVILRILGLQIAPHCFRNMDHHPWPPLSLPHYHRVWPSLYTNNLDFHLQYSSTGSTLALKNNERFFHPFSSTPNFQENQTFCWHPPATASST